MQIIVLLNVKYFVLFVAFSVSCLLFVALFGKLNKNHEYINLNINENWVAITIIIKHIIQCECIHDWRSLFIYVTSHYSSQFFIRLAIVFISYASGRRHSGGGMAIMAVQFIIYNFHHAKFKLFDKYDEYGN